jgi:integrase
VKGHLDVLRACLSVAVEDQLILANPAARLGRFVTRSGETREVETFTRAELTALLETAEREMPDAYPVVLLLARSGLRIGEALTLQVGDLDMSEQLGRVLQELVARREADARHKGQARSPWLFPDRAGEPITPGAFWQNVWRPLLRRSGLPYRKPHTLRHSYASFLIQNRENLAYIRDQLGHHSIKLTVDTYGHLVPGITEGLSTSWTMRPDATSRNQQPR